MSVTLHTSLGDLKIELSCERCPKSCENFLGLCASGKYTGTLFHRNIPEFMVQGGDPSGSGRGGESIWGGYIDDEIDGKAKHKRGSVSFANSGPNTNGSQFFICYTDASHLDGLYTLFGQVIDGWETLDAMEKVENAEDDRPVKDISIDDVTIHANPIADEQEKAKSLEFL